MKSKFLPLTPKKSNHLTDKDRIFSGSSIDVEYLVSSNLRVATNGKTFRVEIFDRKNKGWFPLKIRTYFFNCPTYTYINNERKRYCSEWIIKNIKSDEWVDASALPNEKTLFEKIKELVTP